MTFSARTISVDPGDHLRYDAADWDDALVVVERGVIAVETACGLTWHFRTGDLLSLAGISVASIHNPGEEPAVLLATERVEGVR